MNWIQVFIAFLGRALLSFIFIASGIYKIIDWNTTEQCFTQQLNDWMALNLGNTNLQGVLEFGISNAFTMVLLAVIFEIVGGLMVFFGLWPRFGALLLIIFLIPATLIFHHFWQVQGPEGNIEMVNFMKNMSILGGLVIVLGLGTGNRSKHVKSRDQAEK